MIGLISDIHGNDAALAAVLSDLEKKGATMIYSLGDVAGYYPMINECIAMLSQNGIRNILGNHDDYLVNAVPCLRSRSANAAIAIQDKRIEPEKRAWLAGSPLFFDDHPQFFAVHGGIHDYLDEYVERFQFPDSDKPFFFSGHTHRQLLLTEDGKTYCNPGSVGQPRDGDPRAAYALLSDKELTLCRVAYDIDAFASRLLTLGIPERFFSGLYTGEKIDPPK